MGLSAVTSQAQMISLTQSGPMLRVSSSLLLFPPGARASVVYQKNYVGDRQLKQVNVREVKRRFAELDVPVV
jgi:hypothetical protein